MPIPTLAHKTIVERKGDHALERQSSGHHKHTLTHEHVEDEKKEIAAEYEEEATEAEMPEPSLPLAEDTTG